MFVNRTAVSVVNFLNHCRLEWKLKLQNVEKSNQIKSEKGQKEAKKKKKKKSFIA